MVNLAHLHQVLCHLPVQVSRFYLQAPNTQLAQVFPALNRYLIRPRYLHPRSIYLRPGLLSE